MDNFTYDWSLKDLQEVPKNGLNVFSCFSGGGGSSLGYKMSGCNVVGFCEVDEKMAKNYLLNMDVKHPFVMPIQKLKNDNEAIDSIGQIDILDGSPPCSTFSISGNRENDWGKERTFKEGKYNQVLDTLFFDFIDFAKKVNPKVVIAENVKGMLLGNAKKYIKEIIKKFNDIGYIAQLFLLNGSKMGLPQSRERVFFVANKKKKVNLSFNERPIPLKDIKVNSFLGKKITGKETLSLWKKTSVGKGFDSAGKKGLCFNYNKINPLIPIKTITTNPLIFHWELPYFLSDELLVKASSFPVDYKFKYYKPIYILGMSVPPIMIHKITNQIIKQLF